jgi:riboflavin synthase
VKARHVTNPIALILAALITAAIVVDITVYDAEYLLFLARKLDELIEWLAFWR